MHRKDGGIKMKKRNFKIVIICITCVIFFMLSACGTYAWLVREEEEEREVGFGNFRVLIDVWFCDGSQIPLRPLPNETIDVSFNSEDVNYWGNLRTNIIVEGTGEIYLRVMILELLTETVTDVHDVTSVNPLRSPITLYHGLRDNGYWLDNRRENSNNQNDMFVYFFDHDKHSLGYDDPFLISNEYPQTSRTIELITGVPTFIVERPEVSLSIKFLAQAVQRNRFREVWRMDRLPLPL